MRFALCLVAGVNRFSRFGAALPAVTILGVGFAPSPCSLDALCAVPRGRRPPLLALQCCPSCSHYPRRRLCSVAVLARCA
eukprot:scaffold136149_cov136-Phaeocystis_antarctica.AAC.1